MTEVQKFKLPAYLYLDPALPVPDAKYTPFLMCDLHYDKFDVRSKIKQTGDIFVAAPFLETNSESVWSPEMILQVDRSRLVPCPPENPAFRKPPFQLTAEFIQKLEEKLLETVQRYHRIEILCNPGLDMYSRNGETRNEFEKRCIDLLEGQAKKEMDSLRKKYDRKYERLVQKIHAIESRFPEDDSLLDGLRSKYKTLAFDTRESMARLFIDLREAPDYNFSGSVKGEDDVEDAMENLYHEAWAEIVDLARRVREQATRVENYEIHLQYGDLGVGQIAILWKPEA